MPRGRPNSGRRSATPPADRLRRKALAILAQRRLGKNLSAAEVRQLLGEFHRVDSALSSLSRGEAAANMASERRQQSAEIPIAPGLGQQAELASERPKATARSKPTQPVVEASSFETVDRGFRVYQVGAFAAALIFAGVASLGPSNATAGSAIYLMMAAAIAITGLRRANSLLWRPRFARLLATLSTIWGAFELSSSLAGEVPPTITRALVAVCTLFAAAMAFGLTRTPPKT